MISTVRAMAWEISWLHSTRCRDAPVRPDSQVPPGRLGERLRRVQRLAQLVRDAGHHLAHRRQPRKVRQVRFLLPQQVGGLLELRHVAADRLILDGPPRVVEDTPASSTASTRSSPSAR